MKQLTFDDFQNDELELVEKDGLYSLTDLWKKSERSKNFQPYEWIRKEGSVFIDYISNTVSETVLKSEKGKHGGTFAHWQIALAYAKYLSPELHAKVNQVFKERLEENKNPELGIHRSHDRAIDNYRKQGKNEKWIQNRLSGINTRKAFTDTLSSHDCDGYGIGGATNAIYKEVIGGTAKSEKKRRGLSKSDNLRDCLTMTENASNQLAEALAIEKIETDELSGNYKCIDASSKAGKEVKKAVDNVLKPQLKR